MNHRKGCEDCTGAHLQYSIFDRNSICGCVNERNNNKRLNQSLECTLLLLSCPLRFTGCLTKNENVLLDCELIAIKLIGLVVK